MIDWTKVPVGTRVGYSRHYLDTHYSSVKVMEEMDRVGTLMAVAHYPKDNDPLHYPEVLWDEDRDKFRRFEDPETPIPEYLWKDIHPDNVMLLEQGLTPGEKAAYQRKFREDTLLQLKAQRADLDTKIAALEEALLNG